MTRNTAELIPDGIVLDALEKAKVLDKVKATIAQLRCAVSHPLIPEGKHRFNDDVKLVPDVKEVYRPLFDLYEKFPDAAPFREPVNAEELGIYSYHETVTEPMAIRDVLDRIEQGEFSNQDQVMQDVQKIWRNAELFNGKSSEIAAMARRCENELRTLIERKRDSIMATQAEQEKMLIRIQDMSNRDARVIDEVINFVSKNSPQAMIDGEVEFQMLSVGMIRMLKEFLAKFESVNDGSGGGGVGRKRGRDTPA
jgi:hypothetical protein